MTTQARNRFTPRWFVGAECVFGALVVVLHLLVPAFDVVAQPSPQLSALYESGARGNRVNIVLVAEGYRQEDKAKFDADVALIAREILAEPPYDEYAGFFNIYGLFVESAEAGSDFPKWGQYRDTYFESQYGCGGLGQFICLTVEGDLRLRRVLESEIPQYDLPVMLVNQDNPGGGAGVWSATASATSGGHDIVIHELGHLFARLVDEYGGGYQGREGTNTTSTTIREQIPWRQHIHPETPIPTPATPEYANVVGLFEGAAQSSLGWYRPEQFCKMRNQTGRAGFCLVCREAHVAAIYRTVSPIDAFLPAETRVTTATNDSIHFSVDLVQPTTHILDVEWFVDDVRISGTSGTNAVTIDADRFLPEQFEVRAVVRDSDPLAGANGIQREVKWTVVRSDFAMVPRGSSFDKSPLGQNYPNPVAADATTTIDFKLTTPRRVQLRVFDLAGRAVATLVDSDLGEGAHSVTWPATVAPGLYVYELHAGRVTERRKLVVAR